jgi:lipoate-protein ligase A
MKYLEVTYDEPARNLGCDELLLDLCETAQTDEILRIWQPADYFVVLGYSSKIASEVNLGACAVRNIPILRRVSGGGAVLQGPGCLNYSLILHNARRGPFGDIAASFRKILEPHQRLLSRLLSQSVAIEGISDLTVSGKKFSGNSQHRKPGCTLFHGTFLLQFDVRLIQETLRAPSRQPAYRRLRSHEEFLANVPIDPPRLRAALREEWGADEPLDWTWGDRLEAVVRERYAREEWNRKF